MANPCAYSIISPIYLTGTFLAELTERLVRTMEEIGQPYEIIFVEDDSPDDSWSTLKTIQAEIDAPIRLIRLSRNFGQHKALLCGMQYARATEAVVLMDSDLQTPPEEVATLIRAFEQRKHEVIYGLSADRAQAGWRQWGSRMLGSILQSTGALAPVASSFKLITKPLVDRLARAGFEYIFLDAMINWYSGDIGHVEVARAERPEGESSYNLWGLLEMALRIVINYTALPLRIMTYTGLSVAVICFGLGVYFIINKIIYNVPLGFTATIVIITFGLGLILFCLGIIGDYIRRLYFVQLSRPVFTVKEVLE